jgi:hypothetical protein
MAIKLMESADDVGRPVGRKEKKMQPGTHSYDCHWLPNLSLSLSLSLSFSLSFSFSLSPFKKLCFGTFFRQFLLCTFFASCADFHCVKYYKVAKCLTIN